MILTPDPSGAGRVSLVPLRDLLTIAPGDLVVQIGGNLLVFAAAGFLLPVRWPVGIGTVLIVAAGASTVVEALQYLLDLGRVSSVDDVLLNALGAGLAAALSRPLWRRSRQMSEEMATT
jgi:glycopeptide antibiotics resistance protein